MNNKLTLELETVLEIKRPDTLIPKNIKKDVDIAGVIGTYIGEPKEGPVCECEPKGDYKIQVIDYNGRVLKSQYLNEGETFELPDPPDHTDDDGLIFQDWSTPTEIFNNAITVGKSDITIGATYTTEDGTTKLFVTFTTSSELSPTLRITKSDTSLMMIDWGDGTENSASSLSGGVSFPHSYNEAGTYIITISCSGNYCFTGANHLLGSATYNQCLTKVLIGSNVVNTGNYAFQNCYNLKCISMPNGITSIDDNAFSCCYSLGSVTIPNSTTRIGIAAFYFCTHMKSVSIPYAATNIGNNVFWYCTNLEHITIPSITSIPDNFLYFCSSIEKVSLPNTITSIGSAAFRSCYSLKSVALGDNIISVGANAFNYCGSLRAIPFERCNISAVDTYLFYNCCSLTSIKLPAGVRSIASAAFASCDSIISYDFTALSAVPTIVSNTFITVSRICKIYVKQSLLERFKSATNWATFASYMVGVPDEDIIG